MVALGALINAAAILVGASVGHLAGDRLSARMRQTILAAIGLFVVVLGVNESASAFSGALVRALGQAAPLVILGSLLLGGALGETAQLEQRLERLGTRLERTHAARAGAATTSRFAEGFVVATLIFCVGPLAILGSVADGLHGDLRILLIKAVLDGVTSIALAASLGWGVAVSALAVVVYEGTLSLVAAAFAGPVSAPMIAAVTATGGILVLAIGLKLLEVAQIRITNLLPAIAAAPAAVALAPFVPHLLHR